jgi:DNA mismatch repair protein MutS
MFQQYGELKSQHPDAVLFFRMGDFYEVFYEDAELCAKALDLTLTARNKHSDPIPMAGVPHHAASGYVTRLTEQGFKVAIAEQVEDPALAKGLVRREVVRVVTPGVVYDPTTLRAESHNWLAAVTRSEEGVGLAFLDASTGDLRLTQPGQLEVAVAELVRLEPRELLIGPGVDQAALSEVLRTAVPSHIEDAAWTLDEAHREVHQVCGADPAAFGIDDGPGLQATGAALRYARDRLGGTLANVHRPEPYRVDGFMVLDQTTRRNLELTRTVIDHKRKGSLLSLLDRASTSMGSRLLEEWLAFPLLQLSAIEARQGAVAELVERPDARSDLRAALQQVADIERIRARVGQGTAHARDLAALSRALEATPAAVQAARSLRSLADHLPDDLCDDVAADLATWLVDDPPLSLTEAGLIRTGAHAELDRLTRLSLEGVGIIGEMEEREREATGISSLRIRKNKVFGYFIEVTRANLHKVPTDRFLRKQTLSNAERYITDELKELEDQVLGADERRKQLEYELFVQLRQRVAAHSARLATLARCLASLDALAALAEVAVARRWCRPALTDEPVLEIEGGRHPMVEEALREERFVPNDVSLHADRQLIVLTGPNMSGKSTVMRQTALIALLAQIGSFVPAESATVGLCDRIFTRVGAADDLRRGQSTFMVEMAETSAILHHATARSLVVLDEIGRGTSTYDGLSIAWAVAEDLVDRIGCRAMFATHYHELCELADDRPGVVNQSVAVSEFRGEIVFLRKLKDGGASRSYGIQCARLAGLPGHVIERADRLLTRFEKHAPRNDRSQLSLFGAVGAPADDEPEPADAVDDSALREALAELDPDEMSPRQAHDALYALRELLRR